MCNIPQEMARILSRLIEMRDRMFLHVLPSGSYNEQTETPAEKRRRKQAIQLIRQYEANRKLGMQQKGGCNERRKSI